MTSAVAALVRGSFHIINDLKYFDILFHVVSVGFGVSITSFPTRPPQSANTDAAFFFPSVGR